MSDATTTCCTSFRDPADDADPLSPRDEEADQPPGGQPADMVELGDPERLAHEFDVDHLLTLARAVFCESLSQANAAIDPLADHSVRIALASDTRMAKLHEERKNIPGTTDVLTFDLRDENSRDGGRAGRRPAPLDVDIVLCVDVARRQAQARDISLEHELLLYFVHGLLHCLGHNDHDPADARVMHAREDEILKAVGVGPIYASNACAREETP